MTTCVHHWLINTQGTEGRCKKCGAVQSYSNERLNLAQYKRGLRQLREEIRLAKAGPLR
jgi:hypothetical protein